MEENIKRISRNYIKIGDELIYLDDLTKNTKLSFSVDGYGFTTGTDMVIFLRVLKKHIEETSMTLEEAIENLSKEH